MPVARMMTGHFMRSNIPAVCTSKYMNSEGGVTLRCGDVLFCGDTLFAGSCGRTDFPGGSVHKILASLKRLGSLAGDLKVYPGHMEPSTLERERAWNPYLRQAMNG